MATNQLRETTTSYGKSLCYQALPFIMDFKLGLVGSQKHSLVLVVSPLVVLMVDQVTSLRKTSTDSASASDYISYLHVIGLDPAHLLRHSIFNYAHAQTVYTRPSSPPPHIEGLGTRL